MIEGGRGGEGGMVIYELKCPPVDPMRGKINL